LPQRGPRSTARPHALPGRRRLPARTTVGDTSPHAPAVGGRPTRAPSLADGPTRSAVSYTSPHTPRRAPRPAALPAWRYVRACNPTSATSRRAPRETVHCAMVVVTTVAAGRAQGGGARGSPSWWRIGAAERSTWMTVLPTETVVRSAGDHPQIDAPGYFRPEATRYAVIEGP